MSDKYYNGVWEWTFFHRLTCRQLFILWSFNSIWLLKMGSGSHSECCCAGNHRFVELNHKTSTIVKFIQIRSTGNDIELTYHVVTKCYGTIMNLTNNQDFDGIIQKLCIQHYRVPPVSSFFRLSESNPPKCVEESYEVAECHCQGRENGGSINVTCENAEDANRVPLLKSKYSCSGSVRRKRATFADEDGDFISLDYINSKIDHSKDTYVENINAVWPTPSGITQQQATDRCNVYFQSLPAYPVCAEYSNVPALVQTCVFDIQVGINIFWVMNRSLSLNKVFIVIVIEAYFSHVPTKKYYKLTKTWNWTSTSKTIDG